MIGIAVSHYIIKERLGEGGMGIVYKAEDTKLKRTVALKFLPPSFSFNEEAKQRFIHEAQAASALDHKNICTIYEIGETEDLPDLPGEQLFICMAYYEGETLKHKIERQRLGIEEAIDITIQIAEGLEESHKKDIFHRDIKPANIFITTDGVVKILDFGLAKVVGQTQLTQMDSTVGTIAYMSPEQSRGGKIDNRTDIWSIGVVFYEMLAGQLPFKGEYDQAIIYSILNEAHEPLSGIRDDIPIGLTELIDTILQKNPDDRYQNMGELLSVLRAISGGTKSELSTIDKAGPNLLHKMHSYVYHAIITVLILAALYTVYFFASDQDEIKSIAILPLENLSGNQENEYFVDGMTDALIGELAQISGLRVISRTSIMQYKKVSKPIPEIADELNVDALVEGSVFYDSNQVRITVQLIQANPEQHLWASAYKRDLQDIFALQEEVVKGIAQEINVTLTPDEQLRLSGSKSVDPEVYKLYLKGYYNADKLTIDGLNRSIEYYNKALAKDPDFALGYMGLAEAYLDLGMWRGFTKEAKLEFQTAAIKAIEIDSTFSEIYRLRAMIKFWHDWDPLGAEIDLKRALKLNPNSAPTRDLYCQVLIVLGRLDEAIIERERAIKLDPLSHQVHCNGGYTYLAAKQYDKAIEHSKYTTEQFGAACSFEDLVIGWAYIEKAMYDQALSILENRSRISKDNFRLMAAMARTYALKGQKEKAIQTMAELNALSTRKQGHPGYYLSAIIYSALGKKDEAFKQLEKAYETRDWQFPWIKVDQRLDPLRSDPRFKRMTQLLTF